MAPNLVRPEDYHFWQGVEYHIPKQFQKILIGFRVDSGRAKMYRQLIDMRYEEHQKIAEDVWHVHMTHPEEKFFRELPREMQSAASAIRGTAVGATDHIRRGKLEKNDPLVNFLTGWLVQLCRRVFKFVKRL